MKLQFKNKPVGTGTMYLISFNKYEGTCTTSDLKVNAKEFTIDEANWILKSCHSSIEKVPLFRKDEINGHHKGKRAPIVLKNGVPEKLYYALLDWKDKNMKLFISMNTDKTRLDSYNIYELYFLADRIVNSCTDTDVNNLKLALTIQP